MKEYKNLILKNPITGNVLDFDDEIKSYKEGERKYENFNGLHDLFLEDNNQITQDQSDFYNEVKFPNYDDIDDFGSLIDKASKSLFAKKLDDELPYNSKILEAGCGTGQLSIFLSRYNRKIFGIDLSKGSLLEAKKFIDKNSIENVNLFRMNIFNLMFEDEYFDYIVSNGVLHHTYNPKLAFEKLTKKLKKDGYIIIGLYHKYGRIIQKLRQLMIKFFGSNMKFLDKRFSENISDKKKYAWFLDQYKNPSETTHTLLEVIEWFNECGIEFISSIPFNFHNDNKLFEKKLMQSNLKTNISEISLAFNSRQIYEGGFFIVIGKKK